MKTRVQEYIDGLRDDPDLVWFDMRAAYVIDAIEKAEDPDQEEYDALVCKVFVFGRR